MEAAVSLFRYDEKKPPPDNLPSSLVEYLIASDTGWSLEYIRNLSIKDHLRFTLFSQIKNQVRSAIDFEKIQISAIAAGMPKI